MLEGVVDLGAHVVDGHAQLDAAGGVLQRAEARLAHHALEHHAAGHADPDGLRLQHLVGHLAVLGLQRHGAVLRLEIVGERHRVGSPQRGQFFAALGDQLVVVCLSGEGGGRRGLGHCGPW